MVINKIKEIEGKSKWIKAVGRVCPLLWRDLEVIGYSREIMKEVLGIDSSLTIKMTSKEIFCRGL